MTQDQAHQLEEIIAELEHAHHRLDGRLVSTLVMVAFHQMAEEHPDGDLPALARRRAHEELTLLSQRLAHG